MLLCSFTKKKTGRTWQCFSRLVARHFQNALIACCYVSRAQLVQLLKCLAIGIIGIHLISVKAM